MVKVIFINPQDTFLENAGDRPPLGLAYLSAYLKKFGHETKIIDMNHQKKDVMLNYLEELDDKNKTPDYLCFTVATPNYNQVIELVKEVKMYSIAKVIAGGSHVAAFPNEPKTLESFDYIVTGTDGEEALLRIIEGKATEQIVRSKDIENLDDLPYPDYEGLKLEKYTMKVGGKKGMMLVASRGCVYSCFYCGSASIKKFRNHSPKYVVKHMDLLFQKYGIRGFYFGDDIFTFKPKWVHEWCELVAMFLGQENITIRITTRSNLLNQNMCHELKQTGVDIISIGLESGSPKVLKAMRKHESLEVQKQGVEYCYKAGIKVKGFFIFGNPEERWEDIMLTINFAKELVQTKRLHYADAYILNPIPASPFWQTPEEFNIKAIKPKDSNWENYYQVGKEGKTKVNIKHPYLTEEQLNKAIELFHKTINVGGLTYD